MKNKRKYWLPILILLLLILLILAWRQGWLPDWNVAAMRAFILSFGTWAIVIYIFLMALNTLTFMPPTIIMMVMSGILFGPFKGGLALWTGMIVGSVISFLIARFLAQDFVSTRLGGRLGRFNEQLKENGFSFVFVARLLGFPPYELLNYACGLSKISFKDFLLASMLGPIPGAIIIATTGDRLLHPDLRDPLLYALPVFILITLIVTRLVPRLKKQK